MIVEAGPSKIRRQGHQARNAGRRKCCSLESKFRRAADWAIRWVLHVAARRILSPLENLSLCSYGLPRQPTRPTHTAEGKLLHSKSDLRVHQSKTYLYRNVQAGVRPTTGHCSLAKGTHKINHHGRRPHTRI